jgi:hypothetical protein
MYKIIYVGKSGGKKYIEKVWSKYKDNIKTSFMEICLRFKFSSAVLRQGKTTVLYAAT